jgi:hypothetical protein
VYELDATSSGIQLVSLLIKSRALGKISNVVGKGYTDIYKSYAHDFNDMMNTAKTFITGILKELTMPHLTKLINEERITDISKADTLGKSIRYFLYCNETELPVVAKNLSISIGKLILTKRWKPINLKIPNNLYWMFNTFHKEFYTKLAKDNISYILRLLLYARVTFEYFACLADNPWIDLTNRNLYKKPIMSYAYNMGRTGRIAHYIEYFNDNANERGFTSVNQHSIESLSRIIDNYFLVFDAKYLRDGRDFLNIIKGYITHSCNVKQPIGITNQYVSWEFKPYKTTVDRVWLFKKHKLSIYTNTDEIDEDKAVTSFSSIFVHSIDAHIVFLFESMISEIKHELANKGIKLSISTFTNHDNFGIILAFAIYLKIILKDNYNSISNFEYLKQLGNPITNEILVQVLTKVNLICENDNFIKH